MNIKNSLYIDKIDCNFDDFIEILLKNYDKKNITRNNAWNCLVETSCGNEKIKIPENILSEIQKIVTKFEYILKDDFFNNMKVCESWYNIYTKNMYQEKHTHSNYLFSGCFYLRYNKKVHSPTIFYNNNFSFDYHNESFSDVELIQYIPNIEEKDVIIFPSFMPHEVKPQITDEERITISFNIICDKIDFEEKNNKIIMNY